MSASQIIWAWKDEEYWLSLSASQQSLLQVHPAGLIELPVEVPDQVAVGPTAHHGMSRAGSFEGRFGIRTMIPTTTFCACL
jgi:mersacidin/lichenicidin family type 2 lantibiotic